MKTVPLRPQHRRWDPSRQRDFQPTSAAGRVPKGVGSSVHSQMLRVPSEIRRGDKPPPKGPCHGMPWMACQGRWARHRVHPTVAADAAQQKSELLALSDHKKRRHCQACQGPVRVCGGALPGSRVLLLRRTPRTGQLPSSVAFPDGAARRAMTKMFRFVQSPIPHCGSHHLRSTTDGR